MNAIQELQEKRLQKLGDDPVGESLKARRKQAERIANKAGGVIEEQIEGATIDQAVKAYSAASKEINIMDGVQGATDAQIIILPGNLIQREETYIKGEIVENSKNDDTNTSERGTVPVPSSST